MKIGSPSNIEILLHYYTCPAPHPRIDAPAVMEATDRFVATGCIEVDEDTDAPNRYKTTPKGSAWVKALCNTVVPRQCFVDDAGNVID